MNLEQMNPEDMSKDQRQQFVELLMRRRAQWVARVPLMSPEASKACEGIYREIQPDLKRAEEERQRKLQRWIEEGGEVPSV